MKHFFKNQRIITIMVLFLWNNLVILQQVNSQSAWDLDYIPSDSIFEANIGLKVLPDILGANTDLFTNSQKVDFTGHDTVTLVLNGHRIRFREEWQIFDDWALFDEQFLLSEEFYPNTKKRILISSYCIEKLGEGTILLECQYYLISNRNLKRGIRNELLLVNFEIRKSQVRGWFCKQDRKQCE